MLDCNSRADGRLFALLALADEELIEALGGRRRVELRQRYEAFASGNRAKSTRSHASVATTLATLAGYSTPGRLICSTSRAESVDCAS